MKVRSRPIRTRVAALTGGIALAAALIGYLLPDPWTGAGAGLGIRLAAAAAVIGLVAGGGWLGWLLAKCSLRPLREIADTARRVDASALHTRMSRSGRPAAGRRKVRRGAAGSPGAGRPAADEVAELAGALDVMLARLERACQGQHQFMTDAVEQMRAPIAVQRALLQGAVARPEQLSEVAAALLEVTGRQERLVDELLTLAKSESAVAEPVPVELADIAYRVSDGLEPEARRAGIELRVSAGPARTPGDPILLERLAQNLLQNAVRYNTADGWVRVATGTDGNKVRLTVANTGPVVPTGEVPALFEPFRRMTSRVDAAGLGLSIVRSVARAHGGQVSAEPRDGGGLVVEVTLPAH